MVTDRTLAKVFALNRQDEWIGLESNFHEPTGVTVDKYGNVFVCDAGSSSSIHIFNEDGIFMHKVDLDIKSPRGIALDEERGWVFVSSNSNRLFRF